MKSAAVQHLESVLQARKLAGTIPALDRQPPAMVSTGLPGLDRDLGGGWRQGEISELVGGRSSGRTTAIVATLRAATAGGSVAAVIDAVDRFDPASAERSGVALGRVLWVRGPAISVEAARPSLIDDAVTKAVRAFDLIVRAGGFSVVILDLADVPPRYVRALPQATWLRVAHANEGRTTACVLVGQAPMGRSARGTTLSIGASHIGRSGHRIDPSIHRSDVPMTVTPMIRCDAPLSR